MMRSRFFVVLAVVAISALAWAGAGSPASKDESSAATAFAKFKSLAGQWEADSEKGKVTSTYEVVSNGTAVVEHVNVPGESQMVTVYYLDGAHLVMTHYCSSGNQPHMQAGAFDTASNQIRFDFVNATNLSPGDGHMHAVQMRFLDADAFNSDWTFYKDGKAAFTVPLQFHRVR